MPSDEHPTATDRPDAAARSTSTPRQFGRGRTLSREVATWIAGIAATLAFAVLTLVAGAVLGVFGLSGVALLGIGVLLGLAAWSWRQAALPLSVVGLTLAAGACIATLEPVRIARSAGVLTTAPTRAADLQGADLRRGLGSVVVDLRRSEFQPNERIAFAARSDVGRVVVVLPLDACVDVSLRATPLRLDESLAGSFVVGGASSLGIRAVDDRWSGQYFPPSRSPFQTEFGHGMVAEERGPIGNGVSLFGRDLTRPWSGEPDYSTAAVHRSTGREGAAHLDLTLAAAGPISVTALPGNVGPLADTTAGGPQLSDATWPRMVELPISPEQEDRTGRWRTNWSAVPGVLARWREWERDVALAALGQAQRLAGPCASESDRRNQWVTVRYGLRPGYFDHVRVIAVNALGETFVGGAPGSRMASRRRADIVRGPGLSLLEPKELRARQLGWRAMQMEVPR